MVEQKSESGDYQKSDGPLLHFNHLKRFTIVIGITLSSVALFGGIGYWLDLKFDTKPLLLVIGVLISFPFTQYALYRKMKQFTEEQMKKHSKVVNSKTD